MASVHVVVTFKVEEPVGSVRDHHEEAQQFVVEAICKMKDDIPPSIWPVHVGKEPYDMDPGLALNYNI
jgi:hypothetical protein